jgi:hypothetical protein
VLGANALGDPAHRVRRVLEPGRLDRQLGEWQTPALELGPQCRRRREDRADDEFRTLAIEHARNRDLGPHGRSGALDDRVEDVDQLRPARGRSARVGERLQRTRVDQVPRPAIRLNSHLGPHSV